MIKYYSHKREVLKFDKVISIALFAKYSISIQKRILGNIINVDENVLIKLFRQFSYQI